MNDQMTVVLYELSNHDKKNVNKMKTNTTYFIKTMIPCKQNCKCEYRCRCNLNMNSFHSMNTEQDILNHISLNDKLMTTCKCFNHCFGC